MDPVSGWLNNLLSTNVHLLVRNLPEALVTLIIGLVVIRATSWIASWLLGFVRMPKGLREIIVSLIDALLAVFLMIVVLQTLGLNNLAFVFTAAVAGLGIALGSGS